MQIVRDLGGYTLGRSDLVRRAMSKKKGDVMERERKNFIYGNPEENVKGCINNGIPEEIASIIYDEMIDFAKYAFNKSHAAAYAVVSYQTAYLKYYYPVEFMAALMTSVIDNSAKVSEYILTCKQMGIDILPPDINDGEWDFSVSGGKIRYGLSAIKSVRRNIIDTVVEERNQGGPFTSLRDFIYRLTAREVNKRTVESFIKSGALDSLPGTRQQKLLIYADLLEQKTQEKKSSVEGQMSLFDLMGEESKEYDIKFPDVGEFPREVLLAFEKEVLGIYISGHPLEDDAALWKKNITAKTSDFYVNEEEGIASGLTDGRKYVVGGMINAISVKTTKQNRMMAFLTLEDLVGNMEVMLFPREYETYRPLLIEDSKVFISGRADFSNEEAGKLICEKIIPFADAPKELWIQFDDKEAFDRNQNRLSRLIQDSDGRDPVVIYLSREHAVKRMPPSYSVLIQPQLLEMLNKNFGEKNVKVVAKSIENF